MDVGVALGVRLAHAVGPVSTCLAPGIGATFLKQAGVLAFLRGADTGAKAGLVVAALKVALAAS